MAAYPEESLDVNIGEVNFYYHELLDEFAQSSPITEEGVNDPRFNLYRKIIETTIQVSRERNMGKTWANVLPEHPGVERLRDDKGRFWIKENNAVTQALEEPQVAVERLTPKVWLAQNGFLPKEQLGQIYDAQPDITLRKGETGFDLFFYLKLCNRQPLNVDDFLSHQLITNFEQKPVKFNRYITLTIEQHKWLPPIPPVVETAVNTWFGFAESTIATDLESNVESGLRWTGTKVDFIKLMYALHYTGWINNGEGSITGACEKAARFFDVDYRRIDNTLSVSLSTARKNGYDPLRFAKAIEEGFNQYLQSLDVNKK